MRKSDVSTVLWWVFGWLLCRLLPLALVLYVIYHRVGGWAGMAAGAALYLIVGTWLDLHIRRRNRELRGYR